MPIPADFLPQFNAFRVDDWCNWFFAFFAGSRPKPELIITREEPVAALLDLFDSLTDRESRRALANAAISMLEHEIPAQQDAERIFALLQVVSYTKPLHSKRTLDRLLNDGTLWHIHGSRDQSTPLQYALLSVRGEFGIDNNLVSYIHLSAAQHSTFDYLILCVRVLQRRSVWLAWFYLARLLVRHLSAEQEILVAQIVRAAVLRDKAREAFEWIHRHNRPNSRCLSPEASSRLMHVLATDVVPWTTTLLLPNHDPYHPLLSALSLSSPTDLSETDRRALITLTDHPTVDSTHLLYVIARLRSSFQRHSERSLLAACNEYLTERLVPWDPGFLKDVHPEVCVTAAELNLDVYPFTLRDRLRLARVGTGPVLEERVSNILTEINLRLPSFLIDPETNPNWSNAYPDVSLVEGDDFQLVGPIDSPEAYLFRRVDQHTFKLKESSSNGTTRIH